MREIKKILFPMNESIDRFRQLLRIPSVSGSGITNGSYQKCSELLQSWMREIGLVNIRAVEYVSGKPVVIGTRLGTCPELPSILLNGHYDVVPVDVDSWSVDPFSADLRSDGKIIARGTQDMKCVVVQYLEALRLLQTVPLVRTVHVSFLPDEEVGGIDGASRFVPSAEFASLNIAVALDEGLANPLSNVYSVFYGERASNWVILTARGSAGHGSRFVCNTAIEKITRILARIYAHRSILENKCHSENLKLGDVLSMNVTAMKAGVESGVIRGGWAINVIPTEAQIAIDIRVPLSVSDIEHVIKTEWIQNESDVSIDFVEQTQHPPTTDNTNEWIEILANSVGSNQVDIGVFPAGTDGRYIRMAGVPCIGFSPLRNTPILLHDKDEFVHEDVFSEGILVYAQIIRNMANHANTLGMQCNRTFTH